MNKLNRQARNCGYERGSYMAWLYEGAKRHLIGFSPFRAPGYVAGISDDEQWDAACDWAKQQRKEFTRAWTRGNVELIKSKFY